MKRGVSEEEKSCIRIPEVRPNVQAAVSTKEAFEECYNITRCDKNFEIASEIKRQVDNVRSEDEKRWNEIIEGYVFKRLRDIARKGENDKHKPKAEDVIKRFRVYKPNIYLNLTMYANGITAKVTIRGS
ncbi:hypothetical protein SLS60_002256 [Paraconiothyrium brasiliense]|uniref:Uncharacterized protein n=1 Tax=Paraconiothyrium brasiliense TaxID=300254 RepID=A0ABR3S1M6_9PLEO